MKFPANCLIIAGEKSGEEHALSFYTGLKQRLPGTNFWGVGGDELQRQGMELIYHLKDFSSWGLTEVVHKIPFYFQALKKFEQLVQARDCRVAILIDFQDFNLRLAKRLNALGVQVLYYVAPQAWAWRPWRAKTLGQTVHTLFTILPFERTWFAERGVRNVIGVEHPVLSVFKPLLSRILEQKSKRSWRQLQQTFTLLLLPGSRNFEIASLLPEFIEVVKKLREDRKLKVILLASPNVRPELYEPYESYFERAQDLETALAQADLCLASSGTVTLSTALFELPTVVCYRSSLFNEFFFYNFLSYRGHISLANIVHQAPLFPELLQNRANSFEMLECLKLWLDNEREFDKVKQQLHLTQELLQGQHEQVADYMAQVMQAAYEK